MQVKGLIRNGWFRTECPNKVKFVVTYAKVGGVFCTNECKYFNKINFINDEIICIDCNFEKSKNK